MKLVPWRFTWTVTLAGVVGTYAGVVGPFVGLAFAQPPSVITGSGTTAEFPAELVQFTESGNNPVFTAAGPGTWEVKIRERGWILADEQGYRMWYTGYDGTRDGTKSLGYAESPDGIHWTRPSPRPQYAEHWIEDLMVLRHAERWLLFAEGAQDQAQWFTSTDGLDWRRQGPLAIAHADGRPIAPGPYGTPFVWHEAASPDASEMFYLMYERQDAGVWLATSPDLKRWTLVQDDPVLTPGPEAYDREMIAVNQVVRHGGRYYAYYHGTGSSDSPRIWNTNVAVSTDRLHWTKYQANPLVQGKSSGIVVPTPEGLRLYTMHDQVDLFLPRQKP